MNIIYESEMIIRKNDLFVEWFDEDDGWVTMNITPGWHKIRILDVKGWHPHQIEQNGKWYDVIDPLISMIDQVKNEENFEHYDSIYGSGCLWNIP